MIADFNFYRRIRSYSTLLRASHWVKNFFVLIPVLLSKDIFKLNTLTRGAIAFFIFCVAASAVYVWNDIIDRQIDKIHPHKSSRPIASGAVKVFPATILSAVLGVVAIVASFQLGLPFVTVIISYLVLNVLYSLFLKHLILVDVFALSANYLLRMIGGTVAINESVTTWVITLGTLLALFLALAKRRGEYAELGDQAGEHRSTLSAYTPYFLDQLMVIVAPSMLTSWILYSLNKEVSERMHTVWLPITIPLVLYGIFRYLYLLQKKTVKSSPTQIFLTDSALLVTVLLWIAIIFFLRVV